MPSLRSKHIPWLSSRLLRRVAWNIVPASVVVGVLWVTMTGDAGLLTRQALKLRLIGVQDEVQRVEATNRLLEAEIEALKRDPQAVRRAAAEELGLGVKGSTIYRFDSPGSKNR